jgi:putative SOS response-associated peptidase YedK
MCGRFTLRTPWPVLIEHFQLDVSGERQLELFEPRYNIAPTQEIMAVRADVPSGRRYASMLRWGLVPSWSKEPTAGAPMINARGESLAEKPTFRTAFRSRRCLIPADGFYEWQQPAGGGRGNKQPYYIHRRDGAPFAFAGLWEAWRGQRPEKTRQPEDGDRPLKVESCTIVTTAANSALSDLHDRMPVILAPGDYDMWLDPDIQDAAALQHLIAPCGDDELVAEPVSTHVNRVANDDPRCIEAERMLFG